MTELLFPREEYEARWERVHAELKKRGYTAAVIWSRGAGTYERCADVLYLTGYYSTHSGHEPDVPIWSARSFAAVILELGEMPHLHMDEPEPRYELIATDRVDWHMDPVKGVAEEIARRGIKGRVAFVGSDFFPVKYMRELEALAPNLFFAVEDDLVEVVRRIKSRRELEAFREGGETVTLGLNAMMEGLIAGKPEREAAAEAARIVYARGGVPTLMRCNHGKGRDMHYLAREPLTGIAADAPKPGDLVFGVLMGPMCKGYWFDGARTTVCGRKPTREQKELIEDCGKIVEAVMNATRPGIAAKELARIGQALHDKVGGERGVLGEQWPLFGHSNGLFFEHPLYGEHTCRDDDMIEANMVCTSETFMRRPGVGGAAFEQNYIVKADGIELLTRTPMYFWD